MSKIPRMPHAARQSLAYGKRFVATAARRWSVSLLLHPRSDERSYLWIAAILLLAGCGGSDRPATVPIAGKITFGGGAPPAAGVVYFSPVEGAAEMSGRPGSGAFDTSGAYQASAWRDQPGLPPGTYRVRVESWKRQSGYTDDPGESYVPKDFKPADLVVSADESSVTFDVDVPMAR